MDFKDLYTLLGVQPKLDARIYFKFDSGDTLRECLSRVTLNDDLNLYDYASNSATQVQHVLQGTSLFDFCRVSEKGGIFYINTQIQATNMEELSKLFIQLTNGMAALAPGRFISAYDISSYDDDSIGEHGTAYLGSEQDAESPALKDFLMFHVEDEEGTRLHHDTPLCDLEKILTAASIDLTDWQKERLQKFSFACPGNDLREYLSTQTIAALTGGAAGKKASPSKAPSAEKADEKKETASKPQSAKKATVPPKPQQSAEERRNEAIFRYLDWKKECESLRRKCSMENYERKQAWESECREIRKKRDEELERRMAEPEEAEKQEEAALQKTLTECQEKRARTQKALDEARAALEQASVFRFRYKKELQEKINLLSQDIGAINFTEENAKKQSGGRLDKLREARKKVLQEALEKEFPLPSQPMERHCSLPPRPEKPRLPHADPYTVKSEVYDLMQHKIEATATEMRNDLEDRFMRRGYDIDTDDIWRAANELVEERKLKRTIKDEKIVYSDPLWS